MAGAIQLKLEIAVAKKDDSDGLEMGVLKDGTAFLSGRSLAKLCGVAPSAIIYQAQQWKDGKRDNKLAKMLVNAGFDRDLLYIPLGDAAGTYAYTDDVCTIILDYYAFEADKPSDTARENFRKLARTSLRLLIYGATGYDPKNRVPERWKQFHDRMMLNGCPKGYYSVFREISDVVLSSIRAGLDVDAKTIPDISVGIAWSTHWNENGLEKVYGARSKHPHTYPDYFPQAKAGPQDANVYPLASLGAFRSWMQEHYLPTLFPKYLSSKVSQGLLDASYRELILEAVADPAALPAENK